MKGAYVVSADRDLVGAITRAAVAGGDWASSEVMWSEDDRVMLRDRVTGGQLLMYVSPVRFEDDGVPVRPRPGVVLPASPALQSYLVECRWEEQFARTVRAVAALTGEAVWVVDGDGVVRNASDVDPAAIRL